MGSYYDYRCTVIVIVFFKAPPPLIHVFCPRFGAVAGQKFRQK